MRWPKAQRLLHFVGNILRGITDIKFIAVLSLEKRRRNFALFFAMIGNLLRLLKSVSILNFIIILDVIL